MKLTQIPASVKPQSVAPFTGAWIEIETCHLGLTQRESLPSRERGLKLLYGGGKACEYLVAPFTGAWIEMSTPATVRSETQVVAPFTGAWIEIGLREDDERCRTVAPFTGAWIEMFRTVPPRCRPPSVAPFTGAWIEIPLLGRAHKAALSLPSRERGLKWLVIAERGLAVPGRSLHGSVD